MTDLQVPPPQIAVSHAEKFKAITESIRNVGMCVVDGFFALSMFVVQDPFT